MHCVVCIDTDGFNQSAYESLFGAGETLIVCYHEHSEDFVLDINFSLNRGDSFEFCPRTYHSTHLATNVNLGIYTKY